MSIQAISSHQHGINWAPKICINTKILHTETVPQRCSVKKVFLKILQNSQKTPVSKSLFIKLHARPATSLKKRLSQVFCCEFYDIINNTFFLQNTSGGYFCSYWKRNFWPPPLPMLWKRMHLDTSLLVNLLFQNWASHIPNYCKRVLLSLRQFLPTEST